MNYLTAIAKGYFFLVSCGKKFTPIAITNDAKEIRRAVKDGHVLTAHHSREEAQEFFNKLENKGQH